MKYYFLILLLLFYNSCEFLDHRTQYKQINSNTEIYLDVLEYNIENGGCLINNEFFLSGGSYIQKDTSKNKIIRNILDSRFIKHYELKNKELPINIGNINPPFLIYKNANSNILNLVKNQDTLQFILQ